MQPNSPSILIGERELTAAFDELCHHYARRAHDAREGFPLKDRIKWLAELGGLSKTLTTKINRYRADLIRLDITSEERARHRQAYQSKQQKQP